MQLLDGILVLSPSDLVAFTGCEHRTALDRLVAYRQLERATRDDPFTAVLRKHGTLHEGRHLERLRAQRGTVVEFGHPRGGLAGLHEAEAETLAAMRQGADVIYQATFFDGRWRGHADFLIRVDAPSDLGAWSYEAHDTKLARSTKAGALLQLADYSRQLARLQGRAPRLLHVVLGDDTVEQFLYAEVSAYLDTVRARFEAAVDTGLDDTSPEPVASCDVCDWKDRCTAQWRSEDHLSLVAGVRRDQRVGLVAAGVGTRTALAELDPATEIESIRAAALTTIRDQAALQVRSERERRIAFELIPPDPGAPHRGLAALPAPSPGDIFFDMEGDQFAGKQGREYLFGWVDGDAPGAPFHTLWAHDPAAEKAAFEAFIDTVMVARRNDSAMHVYHYAAYEPAAMRRLMGRYATREDEVDELLRAGVFVDLYRVVLQGVRVGVGSYSIKKLEPLYMAPRAAQVTDASTSIVQYELWLEGGDAAALESIREYNQEDCRSLVGLRGWLEVRRRELGAVSGEPLPRPPVLGGLPSPAVLEATDAAEKLATELTAGVPVDPEQQTREQRGLSLLAFLLDWHRRDTKPSWWEYFARQDAPDEVLINDPASLGGLVFEGDVGADKQSRLLRFSFPVQDTKLKAGETVEDPRTVADENGVWRTRRVGAIIDIDSVAGTVIIKRKKPLTAVPTALVPEMPPPTDQHRKALLRLGEWVRDHAIDAPGEFRAVRDLLLRTPPRVTDVVAGTPLRRDGETVVEAAQRCIRDAAGTCIAVQGPPGSGKTYTAAMAIVDQVAATPRRRVAVTALSHRAISHLLGRVCEEADRRGAHIRILQRSDDDRGCSASQVRCVSHNTPIVSALAADEVDIVAGTSWLFAREEMAGRFETLFVDEAGQLSLANVAAMAGCARNLVLLGDPQQLEQPSQGSHPAGAEASALGHLLDGEETIPGERGLFLDITWRMHPDVCGYISQQFYDSRLFSHPDCASQRVLGDGELSGTGLRWIPVEHAGNRSASEQEAVVVARTVSELLGRRWVDRHGVERPLSAADVLVVAPYNAHVAALRRHLPEAVAAGTVDRFQGQEAAVVIYSMATSLAEDIPRGIDFLYSRNRMNVAVSRARCLAIVVCSPQLLRAACAHASDIRLVNALCAFVQRAVPLDGAGATDETGIVLPARAAGTAGAAVGLR
jgi:uncharacterized protein